MQTVIPIDVWNDLESLLYSRIFEHCQEQFQAATYIHLYNSVS